MTESVRFENVVKRFGGTTALDGVSFSVREGEIHALIGENGAGKSTLMRILSGVLQKDSGSLSVGGVEKTFRMAVDAQREGRSLLERGDQVGEESEHLRRADLDLRRPVNVHVQVRGAQLGLALRQLLVAGEAARLEGVAGAGVSGIDEVADDLKLGL